MERILIMGRAGAGKSSLASRLGKKLNLPYFHMDKMFWLPGWIERSKIEMAIDVEKILETHKKWVIDGNYKRVALESRTRASDLITILDYSFMVCIFRVLKRNIIHWNKVRPDMGNDCKEKFDWEFVKFIWSYPKRARRPIENILSQFPDKKIIKFRNPGELNLWLRSL
jgi:adenylate kinase family enzyme